VLREQWTDDGVRRSPGGFAGRLFGRPRRNALRNVVRKQAGGSEWFRLSLESRKAGQ